MPGRPVRGGGAVVPLTLLPLALLAGWWLLRRGEDIPPPGPENETAIAPTPPEKRQPWHPRELVAVLGDARWRHWGVATALSVGGAGKRVVSRGRDEHVRIWDAGTGRPIAALPLDAHAADGVAIDSTGEVVVAGGNNGEVWVWRGPEWRPTRQPRHKANVLAVAFQPKSRVLASAGIEGVVRWGDIAKWATFSEHRCQGNAPVLSLAWSGAACWRRATRTGRFT